MAYFAAYSVALEKKLFKLKKKDARRLEAIRKKSEEVLQNPHRYKPLSGKMRGLFRVHICGSFVLTFEVIEEKNLVRFLDYDHHDNIYE